MEECVVFEWTNLVSGVDHLPTSQAVGVHVVSLKHLDAVQAAIVSNLIKIYCRRYEWTMVVVIFEIFSRFVLTVVTDSDQG